MKKQIILKYLNLFTMNKIIYYISIFIATILLSYCKPKDACDGIKCTTNATCIDGTCVCQNSYNVKGECVPKDDNTFYYAGQSCYCTQDTFVALIISKKNPNSNSAGYVMRFQAPLGGALGSSSSVGEYFTMPSGDSIVVTGVLEGTYTFCDVKGKKCTSELLGKFKGPNQIDCTIRFFELSNYEKTIDECKITLKK
jgi:hypothetical protein